MICPECGVEVPDTCPSCGAKIRMDAADDGQADSSSIKEDQVSKKSAIHPSVTITGLGAILMLISMIPNWYTRRCSGPDCSGLENTSINFGDLTSDPGAFDLVWPGSGLPLMLMVLCASYVLLSIVYSFVTGAVMRQIWAWLGGISLICLVVNYGYVLGEMIVEDTGYLDYTLYVTPHAGWVLAVIGTVAVITGSDLAKRVKRIK